MMLALPSMSTRIISLSGNESVNVTGEVGGKHIGKDIAVRVLEADPNALILTDHLEATPIVRFSGRLKLVVPHVCDFEAYADVPVGAVDYILIPESRTDNLVLAVDDRAAFPDARRSLPGARRCAAPVVSLSS